MHLLSSILFALALTVITVPYAFFATLADGCVLSGEGRHGEAVARLEEALAQCGKADSDLMRVVCLMLLGVAEDSAGRAAVITD